MANKLELTWYNKDKPIHVEPRLLIENSALSNTASEPDFVVETEAVIYLVEVKGEDKLNNPDVIAKKKRGVQYCEVASRWGKANGYKEWKYLFIPSKQVMQNSSFMQLAGRFKEV